MPLPPHSSDPFDLTAPEPTAAAGGTPQPQPWLDDLNTAQREAVEATEGPVLVLAGAGTGKTRVLITRLAHLLFTERARPHEVLAVTFTNKAAREMKTRVEQLLGRSVASLWIGTFHSVGARILRQHAELVGLKPNFTILDADDQVRLLKQLVSAANIDEKRWPARMLAAVINAWKDRGLTPDQVSRSTGGDYAAGKGQPLYASYQERLRTLNAADFGDLLLHNLSIFTSHAEVRQRWQQRFGYLLVDEYQDTNVGQYLWLRLLAQRHRNLCCVGDDDQSIYSWRGAEVGNILRFEKDFAGARIVRLEQNYRSTPAILAAAAGLIARNQARLGKTLWTDRAEGSKISVRGAWDAEEEARNVCEEIEDGQRQGTSLGAYAILVRASFQTREMEERLLTLGIPYRVIGGLRFYEHREIRDGMAYLRVVAQPDDDLAFERIVNVPRRGIGEATVQALHRAARANGGPLTAAAALLVGTDDLHARARKALASLLESLSRWRARLADLPPADLAGTILDESGYTGMLQADRSADAPGRLENLKELVSAVESFESLGGFLEHVALVMDNDRSDDDDKVSLMTLHAAKGLEFDRVFLPGWEEEVFPNARALEQGGESALEEERRLAHVAITRARTHLTISFAGSRRMYNQWRTSLPSRFLDELPAEHVEHVSACGLYRSRDIAAEDYAAFEPEESGQGLGRGRGGYPAGVTSGGLVIGGTATHVDSRTASRFRAGDRVFHQKFGYGHVTGVDANRLEIHFEKTGDKRVIDSFVAPA